MSGVRYTGRRDCKCKRAQHQHGTYMAYNEDKCRCFPCRIARYRHRPGLKSPGSTGNRLSITRRLEALHAMGWSSQQIADRMGMTKDGLNNLRTWPTDRAYQHTIRTVCEVFEQLWDKQPPTETTGQRISVSRTLAWAERRGFRTALAWDDIDNPDEWPCSPWPRVDELDEIAVERIMTGTLLIPLDTHDKKAPELVEAVRRLAARGIEDSDIGKRVGRSTHAINKLRKRNGIPAGKPQYRPGRETAA